VAKCRLTLVLTLLLVAAAGSDASQIPGHIYAALKALESAPPAVQEVVSGNLEAYLCGAAGPDVAYTASYIQLGASALIGLEVFPPGTEGHGDDPRHGPKTGQLIRNMFDLADGNHQETAFALGWLTHYCVDNVIHPLVNQYGGYYAEDADHHKVLEMMESEHVFQKADPKTHELYVLKPRLDSDWPDFPVWLVNNAYDETFPLGENSAAYKTSYVLGPHDEIRREIPPSFVGHLRGSARNVQHASQALLNNHRGQSSTLWASGILRMALAGPPPTPEEYEKLMDPIRMDSVKLEESSAGDAGGSGLLVIDYTANDPRLLKLFCDAWEEEMEAAVRECVHQMSLWAQDPKNYSPADVNLNVGPGGFDPNSVWPGKPNTVGVTVHIAMTDARGGRARLIRPAGRTEWSDRGEWVWCPIVRPFDDLSPEYVALQLVWSSQVTVASKTALWGCDAGQVQMRVPFTSAGPGPYEVSVEVGYAGAKDTEGTDAWYVGDHWSGSLGTAQQEPETAPPAFVPRPDPRIHRELRGLKDVALSGQLMYEPSESDRTKEGMTAGPVGTIKLRIRPAPPEAPGGAGVEGSLNFALVTVPYYLKKEIDHSGEASFEGSGYIEGQNRWRFTARGRYSMKSAYYSGGEKAGYNDYSGDVSVIFYIEPDGSVAGSLSDIPPFRPFTFNAGLSPPQ
jgi:hypothetical protein